MTGSCSRVNGEPVEVRAGATIADLVTASPTPTTPRAWPWPSTAAVIPRSEWATTPARAGSLVEVVSAVAGG